MVTDQTVIGVDLGGTKVLAARISRGSVVHRSLAEIPREGSQEEVLNVLFKVIDDCMDSTVVAIGCGVPSVVDIEEGVVYDVQNISSWKVVRLKELLQERYHIPVHLNNDANCFALGEYYFGKGRSARSFIGLIVGTGMAAGIIINGKLHNGHNCGAGEFGMIPYLDHYYEYYSSGQFFENVHHTSGKVLFDLAKKGDEQALDIYHQFGHHLGMAIRTILYALDPQTIIMGGSVSQAYSFFEKSMWQSIRTIAFRSIPDRLTIEISDDADIPVKGAAALCYDAEINMLNY